VNTTGRETGAQFGLEGRARAAVLATADEIRPDDVPPERAWLPDEAARPVGARRVEQLLRRLRDLGLRLPRPGQPGRASCSSSIVL
jgi:hypothetical protein